MEGCCYWPVPPGLLSLLSYRTATCRAGPLPWSGALLHQTLIKKMPHGLAYRPILEKLFRLGFGFLWVFFFFSGEGGVCFQGRISWCNRQPWLSWSSLCRPDWFHTQRSACLCLSSARRKGTHHYYPVRNISLIEGPSSQMVVL